MEWGICKINKQHNNANALGRKLIERILISKMKRERSFLQDSAKMRYVDFSKDNPRLFQRIPQYHLASYLGITEASLSRISNELN